MKFNYIKYSREQQIILVVLASFILIIISADVFVSHRHNNIPSFLPDSTVVADIRDFENGLESINYKNIRLNDNKVSYASFRKERFPFDPNTIDSADLIRLGFKPFMAHNLLSYRRHGGKIASIGKFRKIYGIDTLLIDSLSSFISFNSVCIPNGTKSIKPKSHYVPKSYFDFEINAADTSLLRRIPNIGAGRAAMIVSYRNRLGGFYSIDQLYEINEIPDSVIDSIRPYVSFSSDSIKKIIVNKCSIKWLKKHPYINYYQAKAIYELRWDNAHKGFLKLEDMYSIKEFSECELKRLLPYLEF